MELRGQVKGKVGELVEEEEKMRELGCSFGWG